MAEATAIRISEQELEPQMLEARARGLRRRANQPFALRAAYETGYQRIEVELSNGFWFAFPPSLFDDLARGTPEQLSELEIDPSGYVLHWPQLNADYDIGGLVQVALGAKKWLSVRELGRLGGKSTSEAKRAAAVANGLKGGRPPKKRKAPAKRKAAKIQKTDTFKAKKARKGKAKANRKAKV